jgi:hypothetical protein
MKHSFGIGFTFRAGDGTLFKLYHAWGGADDSDGTYIGKTNNFAADSNPRGTF